MAETPISKDKRAGTHREIDEWFVDLFLRTLRAFVSVNTLFAVTGTDSKGKILNN